MGERFLGFELIAELGSGTFGRVYLARQQAIGDRLVALKVASDIGGECHALSQLHHPNIVPVYSIHEDPARPAWKALCMPYLGGTTLQSIVGELQSGGMPQRGSAMAASWRKLKTTVRNHVEETLVTPAFRGAPPSTLAENPARKSRLARALTTFERIETRSYVDAVLEIAVALADGLAHAHDRGILHRDLKPANVIVTDDGEPMLVDFNLSEDVKQRSDSLWSLAGGTLPYMAPEQIDEYLRQPADIDQRADLYSLGVIVYELLTGKLPFPSACSGNGAWESARAARNAPAPSARGHNRAVSQRIDVVIRKCLECNSAKRYGSARELREDLERCLKGRPLVNARDPHFHERVGQWAERHAPRLFIGGLAVFAACCAFSAHTLHEFDARRDATAAWATAKPLLDRTRFEFAETVIDRQGFDKARTKGFEQLALFDDGDRFESNAKSRRLPEEDRRELRQRAAEFLVLDAGASLIEAAGRDGEARQTSLSEADRLIRRCKRWVGDQGKTVALLGAWQAEIASEPDAGELAKRADAMKAVDATDAHYSAVTFAMQRRFQAAVDLLAENEGHSPDPVFAAYVAGFCLREKGEIAKAIQAWESCAQTKPTMLRFRRLIGLTESRFLRLLDNNHYAPLRHLDAAVALDGADPDCLLARAYIYKAAGRYSDAIQDVRDAARLGFPPYYAWSALKRLTVEIKDPTENEKAALLEAAEKLKSLRPGSFEDWCEVAKYSADAQERLAAAEEAIKLRPWSIDANAILLERLIEAKESGPRAAAAVARARHAAPDLWKVRLLCGRLAALQGAREDALADAERILAESSFRYQRLAAASAIYVQLAQRDPSVLEGSAARINDKLAEVQAPADWRKKLADKVREVAPDLAPTPQYADLAQRLNTAAATQ